ncbi:MAG TPA: polysaccharide biosynthesis/export family protein [Dongiaceae bacterium]|nr:polysaccharide biosynthesis/export family protein [Dongiaceae bacterium]
MVQSQRVAASSTVSSTIVTGLILLGLGTPLRAVPVAPTTALETQQTTTDGKPKRASADPSPASTQPPGDYRVGVEDELAISVWHEPEFSQPVTVRSDGMITLPLLNDIQVVGLTTEEMQVLLTEKLKTLVNDPQVTVMVKAIHSRKVFLLGNVAKQGTYVLTGRKTVLELIAEAGGLGPFAKTKSIYVLRKENGKEVHLPFNYKKALTGKGDNPELKPGDMVVVP